MEEPYLNVLEYVRSSMQYSNDLLGEIFSNADWDDDESQFQSKQIEVIQRMLESIQFLNSIIWQQSDEIVIHRRVIEELSKQIKSTQQGQI